LKDGISVKLLGMTGGFLREWHRGGTTFAITICPFLLKYPETWMASGG
jgi:hypothetical protein